MMDYSGDCCRSAVSRAAVRGYDSSELECVRVHVSVCVARVTTTNSLLGEEIALTRGNVFLTGFSDKVRFSLDVVKTWLE